jgi:hypothetical protein
VNIVRVALELLVEDTLVGEGTSDGECVPDCCPLRLSPQSQQLANVVNQSCQLQPVFVRVYLSDPLSCLEEVE